MSGTDRLLGMLFGFARGVLLVALLVFLVGFTAFTRDPWWQQSVLLPQFQHVAAWLGQRVPPSVQRYLQPSSALEHLSVLPATGVAHAFGVMPQPASSALHPAVPAVTTSAPEPAQSF